MAEKILYIFIDESGNLMFTPKSSRFFVATAVVTDQLKDEFVIDIFKLKNQLLLKVEDELLRGERPIKPGYKLEYFHATEDLQFVRDEVFQLIEQQDHFQVFSVFTEKRKTAPSLQSENGFYCRHAKWLMQGILHRVKIRNYDRIVILFDEVPVAKNKQAFLKGLKVELASFFKEKGITLPYALVSHQSKSHCYLQLVDYISWAIFVKHERAELRPYEQIKKFISNEFSPFEKSSKYYY